MSWHWIALAVGVVGLAFWLVLAVPVVSVLRRPRNLADVPIGKPAQADPPPRVSVVVPACDEERAIRRCLESLVNQDYPNLEIIAVDDRSTDRTGQIMDELAARHERLHVEHVTALPDGWIGKNHANALGAGRAAGEWLLFTDGDVFFTPDCIRRAVAYAEAENLDHLALFPSLEPGGYWEQAACGFFALLFVATFQAEHTRNPLRPKSYCGVGAFNLVRRTAYQAIGTHQRLRLEVGDDVMLGRLLKRAGFVSDTLGGRPLVSVRWQVGLRGIIYGLEKNGFCGAEYSLAKAIYGLSVLVMAALLPLLGTMLAPGWTRLVYAAWLACQVGCLSLAASVQALPITIGLAYPVAAMTLAVAIARSTVLTLWRGGVRWRGTFYPLATLREAHRRLTTDSAE